jgi:cold shock protein
VASGIITWLNATKGYGFIAPGTGGKDVFAHISAVERSSVDLREGDKVTFDVVESRGKEIAENLRVKRAATSRHHVPPVHAGGFPFGRLAFSSLDRPFLLTAWHLRLAARPWVGLASVSEHPQKMRGRLQSRGSLCWSVAADWHLLNRWWSSVRCCPA